MRMKNELSLNRINLIKEEISELHSKHLNEVDRKYGEDCMANETLVVSELFEKIEDVIDEMVLEVKEWDED